MQAGIVECDALTDMLAAWTAEALGTIDDAEAAEAQQQQAGPTVETADT
jgi:hypothetical protein